MILAKPAVSPGAHRTPLIPLIPLWLVWLVAVGLTLPGLGGHALLDNNEGLYAEIAREMFKATDWRHWVIPHLNGLPYMEKPPLLYWLTTAAFSLFGINEFSARLVPALSALGCVAMLVRFGASQRQVAAGRFAALMFISGIGVCAMARVLMFDMLLTAMLTGALMHAYQFIDNSLPWLKRKHHLRQAYAFLALAVLAKGLVALILFGLVVGVVLAERFRSLAGFAAACKAGMRPDALLVFFAIAAPWHIAASLIKPIFAWFYFINEHVLRFLGTREPHDYYAGAWWYYLPRMMIYLFPWSFFLVCIVPRSLLRSLLHPWRRRQRILQGGMEEQTESLTMKNTAIVSGSKEAPNSLKRFSCIAWIIPLIFFSVSSAKANYYLVAVMPFAALHLALVLQENTFPSRISATIFAALPGAAIAALGLAMLVLFLIKPPDMDQLPPIAGLSARDFVLGVLTILIVLALMAALFSVRLPRFGLLPYLLLPGFIVPVLTILTVSAEPWISAKPLASCLHDRLAGHTVYLYRDFEQVSALPFYLQTPVAVIDSRSNDLFWGNKLQPNNWLMNSAEFAQRTSSQKAAVVVRDVHLQDFREKPYFTGFQGSRRFGKTTVFFN